MSGKRDWIELGQHVAANPDMMSGAPVVGRRRIRVMDVAGRWMAGDSLADLADDWDMDVDELEAGLRYEMKRLRKRQPEMVARTDSRGRTEMRKYSDVRAEWRKVGLL